MRATNWKNNLVFKIRYHFKFSPLIANFRFFCLLKKQKDSKNNGLIYIMIDLTRKEGEEKGSTGEKKTGTPIFRIKIIIKDLKTRLLLL